MLRATLRSIVGHKVRLAMTGLAVVLGVALMAGTLVLTDTIGETFDDLFADIYDGTDAVVRSAEVTESSFGDDLRAPIDQSEIEIVSGIDTVEVAEGGVFGYAQIIDPDGEPVLDAGMGPPTFGINWYETPALNPFELAEGEAPTADDDVVIDKGSADTGNIEVGDTITILSQSSPREMTVSGIALFGTIDSPGGASMSMFTLETAQELFDRVDQLDEISIVGSEGVSQDELAEDLNAELPDDIEAVTGEVRTAEDQDAIAEALGFFNTFLLIFAVIALVVGAFIIYNTFSIVLAQRSRELALLRAVGATRRQVMTSVLGEAVLVGLVASAIGMVLGVFASMGLKGLLAALGFDLPATGLVITGGTVLTAMATGTIITIVAALLPARRASRIPPIAAMRDVAVDSSGRSRLRLAIGLLVLVAGAANIAMGLAQGGEEAFGAVGLGALLVFVGITVLGPVIARPLARLLASPLPRLRGITGTIARENASRNPKRTASTAAALMIGVGLVGFIALFAASASASLDEIIDDNFTGDLVVDSGQFFTGGVSPELADEVRATEGVDAATGVRLAEVSIDDDAAMVLGSDTATLTRIADPGLEEGELAELGEGEVAISRAAADERNWELGDVVDIQFATGTQELRVAGIYEDEVLVGNHVLTFETYEQFVPTQLDYQVYVLLEDGADAEAVQAELEEVVAPWPTAEVQDLTQFKEAQSAQFNQLLVLIYALLLLAIIIALVGIANTLALSIFERTRELGLMRAVGMTRAQLRSAVRWESVVIAVYGTILGLAIGLIFGWAMVATLGDEGLGVLSIPVGTLVVVVLLAGLAGVLAALLPARRAAKLDILRAITAE